MVCSLCAKSVVGLSARLLTRRNKSERRLSTRGGQKKTLRLLNVKMSVIVGPLKVNLTITRETPNAEPLNFKLHLLGCLKKTKSRSNVYTQPAQTYLNVQANLTT